jgi:hypothetical protein
VESRFPSGRIPDQAIIVRGQGVKGEYMTSFRDALGRYGMVYLPVGKKIAVDVSFIKGGEVVAWWYDPRHNMATRIGKMKKGSSLEFTPPSLGGENDWVLVIDDATEKFNEPGKRK